MYSQGNILYFDPFYFKNGNLPKRKYFLVLSNVDGTTILASLPTSVNSLPRGLAVAHGCLDMPDSCINCYVFESGIAVTDCGWSFDKHTFLHGNQIDDYSISILQSTYVVEGVDYEIIGRITDEEFANVKACFINSSLVKRKYKRMLAN